MSPDLKVAILDFDQLVRSVPASAQRENIEIEMRLIESEIVSASDVEHERILAAQVNVLCRMLRRPVLM